MLKLLVLDVELQRHFGRFDILFFLVCTIVGVDTIASVASSGGEAFTWMIVFALAFFVPQALLFAELGTAFPQEGVRICGPAWPSGTSRARSTTSSTG